MVAVRGAAATVACGAAAAAATVAGEGGCWQTARWARLHCPPGGAFGKPSWPQLRPAGAGGSAGSAGAAAPETWRQTAARVAGEGGLAGSAGSAGAAAGTAAGAAGWLPRRRGVAGDWRCTGRWVAGATQPTRAVATASKERRGGGGRGLMWQGLGAESRVCVAMLGRLRERGAVGGRRPARTSISSVRHRLCVIPAPHTQHTCNSLHSVMH